MSTADVTDLRDAPPSAPSVAPRARHGLMLPLLLTGQAMSTMDTSIANVAAPVLRNDLGISGAQLQMVVAGYTLAYAVLLVTGARLGDDYGYRRLFLIGAGLFTLSSLACGLAPAAAMLIAARVAQGVGAALMVPQVLSLIQRSYNDQERARPISIYSVILGVGAAFGQLLGGVAVSADVWGLSWRLAFLINVPIGIAIIACAQTVLPNIKGNQHHKLDLIGVLLLSLSLLMIVVPLTFGREADWASWTWESLAGGVAGLFGFWAHETSLTRRGGHPLLNLEAVLAPGVRPGLAVIVLGFIGYGGWLFAIALYLQSGLGYSALASGVVFSLYAAGFGIANIHWSKLPARLLRWTPAAASATTAIASLLFGLTAAVSGPVLTLMLPLLFVVGSGHGLSFGTAVNQITARTTPARAPALSGLITTANQISIGTGIAALGTLYLSAAGDGSSFRASSAISYVAFTIGAGMLVAIACSLRLAIIPAGGDKLDHRQ
jgi:MFS family permease